MIVGCGSTTKAIITNDAEVEANIPIEVILDLSQVTDDKVPVTVIRDDLNRTASFTGCLKLYKEPIL